MVIDKSTSFEKLLERDGKLVYRTRGTSMNPMIYEFRDVVVVDKVDEPLQKYDVALYKRGNDYFLHRVIGVSEEVYLIRGDNTFRVERVPKEAVLGKLSVFVRKGKRHSVDETGYLIYSRIWNGVYPVRLAYFKTRRAAVRFCAKIGILPHIKRMLRRG